ncbi:hypothetical protein D3C86_2145830 [compost metagenome]
MLKVTLVSGGNIEENERNDVEKLIVVREGIGRFTTYDSGDEGKVKKPEYKFEILGYVKMN